MNLKEILASYKNIAVVGLSNKPTKPSYVVAEYLKKKGYRIIPINPTVNEVLGEKCYKDLKKSLEIVNIFRPAEEAKLIVEETVQLKKEYGKPYVVWMQLGIVNEEAAEKAKKAGIIVVMDKCIMTEHKRIYS